MLGPLRGVQSMPGIVRQHGEVGRGRDFMLEEWTQFVEVVEGAR